MEPLVTDPLSHSKKLGNFQFQSYTGAAPGAQVSGMFSFVPCTPYGSGKPGFARPALDLGDLLNHNLAMAARTTPLTTGQASCAWQQVVDQVLDAGLVLGTWFPLPANVEVLQHQRARGAGRFLSV
jgi:hypothetical protein